MAMQRDIGPLGLTFVATGGVLGSGWLFAPLLASQIAGPGALIAWAIGAVAVMLLALCFAEITTLFPVAGGIARLPQFSHGRLLAMLMGWSAWAGYCTTAPIEVEAALRYSAHYLPWIHDGEVGDLGLPGLAAAAVLVLVFTIINAFGVRWFARVNTSLTWFKLVAPLIFALALIATRFEPANFTEYGGFLPQGVGGIFAAVASGGVVFAFVGFRHVIDMAGEARNPQRTIPLALILSLVIALVVYGLLQVAFLGALDQKDLAAGWQGLDFHSDLGPLGALASAVGILWLVSLLNVAGVVSPLGGALVSVGSNGRLAMAMADAGVFPALFARLNRLGVPVEALLLNSAVSLAILLLLPFREILALNGAAIILSFLTGPVTVLALRTLAADQARPFRLPAARVLAPIGFVIATLMIFWSGWDTIWRLVALLGIGLALFLARLAVIGREDLNPRGAIWFAPYIAGLAILSWLGGYGGGEGLIAAPYDSLLVACLALAAFALAVRSRLTEAEFEAVLARERDLERQEYGAPDPEERLVDRGA